MAAEAGALGDTAPFGDVGDGTAALREPDVFTLRVHGGGAHTGEVPHGFDGVDTHVLDAAPRARLSEEERLQREVFRRRQQELERRARIFDAKRRTIGVDKDFLDKQCAENAERKRRAAEQQRIEDRQFMGANKMLQLMELEKQQAQKAAEKEAKEYSLKHLHFESRREFDINDPKVVTKSLPARVGDEDPRCGPASMQHFSGEDLMREELTRQQQLATRHALEQQKFEKDMLKRQFDGEGEAYQQQCQEIIDLRNEIEANDAAERKGLMDRYKNHLLERMQAHHDKKQSDAEANQELNARELEFHANDKFLNEQQDRFRPDGQLSKANYKGSTREERVEVFGMQLSQCAENAKRRALEGMEDQAHNNHVEMTRRQLIMLEREKQRMRRAMACEVASHNKGMVAIQKEQPKDLHKNYIAPEFFEQFGVGTR